MTIALRKLIKLDKDYAEMEEAARIKGYVDCPIDTEFRKKVAKVVSQVSMIIY